jgi:uncharacterized protein YbjT (DUF2867 family)
MKIVVIGGNTIRLSHALVQPIASDDVAATLVDLALGSPLNSTVEVAGPEARPLDEIARQHLAASQDNRQVIADAHGTYFGAEIDDQSLTPSGRHRTGSTRFAEWLSRSLPHQQPPSVARKWTPTAAPPPSAQDRARSALGTQHQ